MASARAVMFSSRGPCKHSCSTIGWRWIYTVRRSSIAIPVDYDFDPHVLKVLPFRGLFQLAAFPFMVLPLSRPAASCSAQLTAISARKPSFAASCGFSARKPSFMASFSSWPLLGPLVASLNSWPLNTRLPPRVASPRPPYSLS